MSCVTGKVEFTTKISAWQSAIKNSNRFSHKLVPYHCKFCGKRHLTKREDTVKGSTMPFKVGMKLNTITGEKIKVERKKYKKPKLKNIFKMPKPEKPSIVAKIPPWKKKILKFVIWILKIK